MLLLPLTMTKKPAVKRIKLKLLFLLLVLAIENKVAK